MALPQSSSSDEPLASLRGLIIEDWDGVNRLIYKRLGSDVALVNQVAHHIIHHGGKRLRPLTVLLAARACQCRSEAPIPAAAIIEFIHTATLLHDDVVDNSGLRRGQETANSLFGNQASVLVGDFLYSRSFQMMVELKELRVLEVLADATNTIAEGEVLQLMNCNNPDITERDYMEVIYRKTAKLFEAGSQLGAILACESDTVEQALADYGRHLGRAFQLVDDALDYGGKAAKLGKNVGDDFREGKITLPVVLSFRRGSETERGFWSRTLERGEVAEGDLETAIGLMTKHRALEDTIKRAQHYGAIARDALALFPDSKMKQALEEAVEFCTARTH